MIIQVRSFWTFDLFNFKRWVLKFQLQALDSLNDKKISWSSEINKSYPALAKFRQSLNCNFKLPLFWVSSFFAWFVIFFFSPKKQSFRRVRIRTARPPQDWKNPGVYILGIVVLWYDIDCNWLTFTKPLQLDCPKNINSEYVGNGDLFVNMHMTVELRRWLNDHYNYLRASLRVKLEQKLWNEL